MDYEKDDFYCIVEISLFPLSDRYDDEVRKFVASLATLGFDMTTSETSTLLRGPYDKMMPALVGIMRQHLGAEGKKAVVLKVLNGG